jgi:CMP-N,N'-diacetyllegionaminic acid synthase
MEVLGLIPARGGSKGLPGKNIRPLCGKPLIAHTIETALNSKHLTRVIVVTDSEEIASIAREYGAETPFMRPSEISQSLSHAFEVYKYSVHWLKENENYRPDIVCNMLCTTLFRSSIDIDNCIVTMKETDCDWCFTINEIEHHPFRAMTRSNDGQIKSFHNIPREIMWANRQELPKLYRFNGGVIAGKTKHIENHNEYNIGEDFDTDVRSVLMDTRLSVDIDTITDFQLAELIMKEEINK